MTVLVISRSSQGAEFHIDSDPYCENPLVIVPHDAPDADRLEQIVAACLRAYLNPEVQNDTSKD